MKAFAPILHRADYEDVVGQVLISCLRNASATCWIKLKYHYNLEKESRTHRRDSDLEFDGLKYL